jgi:ABC-2 type transport system ATP-binding protein
MIEVQDLTKYYGAFLAVDRISFEVAEGEVVGLLGPNGAGKTTAIRMLTCFMPASAGRATVNGFDIFTQGLQVRESVGYMPENVPLYEDMRVGEYLTFRARLRGLGPAKRDARVDEVIQRCQLTDRRRQIIRTLSKGFRQRVGLADALLADPKVLILDEPTIGLDPGQIREARKLIQELAQRHTVLLSSHILPEVEQVCSRIIMLVAGRIVANGRIDELKGSIAGAGATVLEARGSDADGTRRALAALHGVKKVDLAPAGENDLYTFSIETDGSDVREAASALLARRNWTVRDLHRAKSTLEEFFVQKVAEQGLFKAAGRR